MQQFTTAKLLLASMITIAMAGCVDTGSDARSNGNGNGDQVQPVGSDGPRSGVRVAFDPENQVIPFPTNLLFEADADTAEAIDGTLNIPVENPDEASAAVVQGLNDLDGFSTVGAWRLGFTGDIDPASLRGGETVRVFRMNPSGDTYPDRTRPDTVDRELVAGEDYDVVYKEDTRALKIIPRKPLGYNTTYTAVLTEGVRDTGGLLVSSPIPWSIARGTGMMDQCDDFDKSQVALLQCTTNFAINPIEADDRFALARDNMLMAWGVTTQREDTTFRETADFYRDAFAAMAADDSDFRLLEFLDVSSSGDEAPETPGGRATIWPGTIMLPYGLDAPSVNLDGSPTTDDVFVGSQWQCEGGSCNSDEARGLINGEAPRIPAEKSMQTVPAVMALPKGDVPAGGFPVVIFQHAIQQDRSTALAIADELAEQGFAVVAIDMPLHGIVLNQLDPDNETDAARADLHATAVNAAMDAVEDGIQGSLTSDERLALHHERTFYANLTDDGDTAGEADPSGTHFLIPNQPLAQRDIMRQAALDLVNVANYLRSGYYEQVCVEAEAFILIDWFVELVAGLGCSRDSLHSVLNTDEIHFLGHSVGNIVAAPFLAYDQEIRSATLLAPTGGIMRALEGSDTIGPQLREGLADAGVVPGTEDYFRFMVSVQAALDGVDPQNHAEAMTTRRNANGDTEDRPVYMARITGNTGGNPSPADQVMPDAVDGEPLAGSTPLARSMGLSFQPGGNDSVIEPAMASDGTRPDVLQTTVGFRFGDHASFLLPIDALADPVQPIADVDTYSEMQHQVGSFLRHKGEKIGIIDPDLLEKY